MPQLSLWQKVWTISVLIGILCTVESGGRDTRTLAEGQKGVEAFQRGDFETAVSIFLR